MTLFYCLRFETSLFVATYDSQGYGGEIRPRLHTGNHSEYTNQLFYNCHAAGIEVTVSYSSSVVLSMESCINSQATVWFSVYNF
jgi:hypothetical protein